MFAWTKDLSKPAEPEEYPPDSMGAMLGHKEIMTEENSWPPKTK